MLTSTVRRVMRLKLRSASSERHTLIWEGCCDLQAASFRARARGWVGARRRILDGGDLVRTLSRSLPTTRTRWGKRRRRSRGRSIWRLLCGQSALVGLVLQLCPESAGDVRDFRICFLLWQVLSEDWRMLAEIEVRWPVP